VDGWTTYPLSVVDAARPWVRGRVALIGDAAHAMTPSAAQGGAQAIEDGWVLATLLAERIGDPSSALRGYEEARRPRVERIGRVARRNLRTFEMTGIPALGRDLALRVLPASFLLSRLDWIFSWQPK
jgi:salicylate hydroxylase